MTYYDLVVTFVGCLLGAAFVSSIETALVGLTEVRVRGAIAERRPGADSLSYWLRESGRVLATIHVLRLAFVLGAGFVVWNALRHWVMQWQWIVVTAVLALFVLVFAHLVPRTLTKPHALTWAIATMRMTRIMTALTAPVLWPLGHIARWIATLVGSTAGWTSVFWTPDEINRASVDAEAARLGKRSTELLHSMIEFSDTVIREIMVPRTHGSDRRHERPRRGQEDHY